MEGGQAPEGARPQRRLRLRDGLRRAHRQDHRGKAVYRREQRPAVLGTGLVFWRADRRRNRRLRVGPVARRARPAARHIVAPSLAAAYAIGRIGCQRATATTARTGTARGRWPIRTDGPGDGDRPPDADLRDHRDGRLHLLLWRWRNRWRPGTLMAIYLFGSDLERFLVSSCAATRTAFGSRSHSSSGHLHASGGGWLVFHRGACGRPLPPGIPAVLYPEDSEIDGGACGSAVVTRPSSPSSARRCTSSPRAICAAAPARSRARWATVVVFASRPSPAPPS